MVSPMGTILAISFSFQACVISIKSLVNRTLKRIALRKGHDD